MLLYILKPSFDSVIPYQIVNSKSNNRHSLCHHYITCYMQVTTKKKKFRKKKKTLFT